MVVIAAGSLAAYSYVESQTWKERSDTFERQRDKAWSAIDALEAERKAREQELADREAAADEKDKALAQREKAVDTTEKAVAAKTITEGTWTIGTDIQPGTYRVKAPVTSDMCYWGIYKSGTNKSDIVQNDIVEGGSPTVTLTAGQDFETTGCGEWIKQ